MNELEQVSSILRQLGNPRKLEVYLYLIQESQRSPHNPTLVPSRIAEDLNLPLATVSHHLNQLYQVGLLYRRPSGKYVFYSVSEAKREHLRKYL